MVPCHKPIVPNLKKNLVTVISLFNALMVHLLTATDVKKTKQSVQLDAQQINAMILTSLTVLKVKLSSANAKS